MLPVYYVLILLLLSFANGNPDLLPSRLYTTNISDVIQNSCPPFESIANAKVEVKSYIHGYTDSIVAVITCNENYSLIGRSMVYCDDGAWSMGYDETPAQCVKRCPPPPYLEHGELKLEKLLEDVYIPTGSYLKGTVAKYSCSEGYILKPSASSKRICQNGQWTGVDAFCKPNMETTCPSPPIIENGYMQPSFPTDYSLVVVGQEVLYQCNTDYKLVGSDKLRCTDEGIWIPEPPSCHKETGNPFADFSSTAPPPTAPVANGMPDFFASQPPANNPPSNTQTMWGNSGVPQQNAFQAPPVQQPQQQPAQQPFGDFFNTNEPSVFDPQAPILQQTQPQQSMPPQRPPQPSKILTGDLESSLNSLVDNLTMDSGSDLYPTITCASIHLLDSTASDRLEISSISSSTVEVGCQANYQNALAPCQTSKFYCKNGKWVGVYPQCVEAHKCTAPPAIPFAVVINRNFETSYNANGLPFYPINAKITYECLKGYILDGSPVISCQSNGCWEPSEMWPTCIRTKENYFIELTNINAILISSATGAAVLGILLMACLLVACKKRKALARAVNIPSAASTTPITRPEIGNDHAILLQHPDRLALIAFADGVQNSQNNSLPSYDEATRDRSTLIHVSRLQIQRPHWPNLAICRSSGRSRGSPNIDTAHHVARHGSSASHTPSMRSGGESMGSTDTVTISEGSTNVTLDTASSHSAQSQNPSCRGHCGSLASFDACSMINTEGVPLLEESELEEIQGGTNDIDNPAASDNISSKISTHSAPIC